MAQAKKKEAQAELQIRAIELLHSSLQLPATGHSPRPSDFNISIEIKTDAPKKLVFVIVTVEIRNNDKSFVLGSLTLSCIFEISNFTEVILFQSDGQLGIPEGLVHVLNSISLSTTRGVLFSTFKGTFLHGVVLPIIDPQQIGNVTAIMQAD